MEQNIDNWEGTAGDWTTSAFRLQKAHVTTEKNNKTGKYIFILVADETGEEITLENPTKEELKELHDKYDPKIPHPRDDPSITGKIDD